MILLKIGIKFVVLSIFSLLVFLPVVNAQQNAAHRILRDNGKEFDGTCANGKSFAGRHNGTQYVVSGPNGSVQTDVRASRDQVIRKACEDRSSANAAVGKTATIKHGGMICDNKNDMEEMQKSAGAKAAQKALAKLESENPTCVLLRRSSVEILEKYKGKYPYAKISTPASNGRVAIVYVLLEDLEK